MASKQVKFENLLESDLKKKENSNAKSSVKKNSENIKSSKVKEKSTAPKSNTKKKKTTTSKNNSKKTDIKNISLEKNSSEKSLNKKTTSLSKKNTKASPKKSVSKRTVKGKNSKVSVSQEDMDKLCEVYDWYMQVKDLEILKEKTKIKKTSIKIENDIIKEKKRISAVVDNEVWSAFDRLCNNTEEKKGEMLTFAIKDFLLKHKDLI
ncbi:MAG: DNA-binding protein [Peptostreptococcus sp.]|uniref:hypothetical protein n=1 Tax=Peptostreptococcus sp. TaxID=1262 RepID=UPI002FC9E9C2